MCHVKQKFKDDHQEKYPNLTSKVDELPAVIQFLDRIWNQMTWNHNRDMFLQKALANFLHQIWTRYHLL